MLERISKSNIFANVITKEFLLQNQSEKKFHRKSLHNPQLLRAHVLPRAEDDGAAGGRLVLRRVRGQPVEEEPGEGQSGEEEPGEGESGEE